MRTLVTGATGLVGNNVARLLLAQGRSVRVLARTTSEARPLAGLNVELVAGDITDSAACQAACQGADWVIHAAAHVHIGWSGLDTQRAINVEGTRNMARAARQAGARMVYVSSVDTLAAATATTTADEESPRTGKPRCPYVVTKSEAEQAVQQEVAQGAEVVLVNPTLMFGPWDWKPSSGRMILEVARRFTPLAPSGGGNVVDVRDVAAGILAAAERGRVGRNYILGGDNLTYFELWRLICAEAGKLPPWGTMGPLVKILAGRGGDLAGKLLGSEPVLNSAAIAMSSIFHYYSSARAESELGYKHRPAVESVRAALAWFREYGYLR